MPEPRSYSDADFDVEADQEALERILAHYGTLSTAAYQRLGGARDLAYGPGPAERLDVFAPAGPSRGVVVFFHGGWWRSGSKEGRAFLAEPLVDEGFHFVNVEYPLAPEARLPQIVASAQRAMAWVGREIAGHGGDPRRLIVTGNSAGGHLAACAASLDGLAAAGLAPESVLALVGLSGLYDLAPLQALAPNAWLGLDAATVAGFSPLGRRYPERMRVTLAYGALEPSGFGEQSTAFGHRLGAAGRHVALAEMPGQDHFSIIARLPFFVKELAEHGL